MKKNKQALKLTLLLLVFLAPMIGALFVYQARDGIHFMTKNVGTLIRPPVAFEQLGTLPDERRWWMVYYSDAGCDDACVKAMAYFDTIRQSLLEDSPRLGIMLVTKQPASVTTFKNVHHVQNEAALPAGLPTENGRGLWLMDPHGNIILNYDPVALDNRLLLDLRHLLKVSRIG